MAACFASLVKEVAAEMFEKIKLSNLELVSVGGNIKFGFEDFHC